MTWITINFFLFLAVVVYLYNRLGRTAVRARSVQIRKELENAASVLSDAEQRYARHQDRLASIELERRTIVDHLRREGEESAQDVLRNAHRAAERVRTDALQRIEMEREEVERNIRADVIRRATQLAREKLSSRLSASEDKKLRREVRERFFS